jgi:hypothetical protein
MKTIKIYLCTCIHNNKLFIIYFEKLFERDHLYNEAIILTICPATTCGVSSSLLKDVVMAAVLDYLNGGEVPVGLNDTSTTLFPEVKHPQNVYHHIDPFLYALFYTR